MAVQLPDFDQLGQDFQRLSTELGLLRNLPQVQTQEQLTGMQQSIDDLTASLADVKITTTAGFVVITAYYDAMEHNSNSRALNGHIRMTDTPLYSIVNSRNQPIPNLPQSIAALEQMEPSLITSILQQMGVPDNAIPQTVAQQINLLKNKFGIPTVF